MKEHCVCVSKICGLRCARVGFLDCVVMLIAIWGTNIRFIISLIICALSVL